MKEVGLIHQTHNLYNHLFVGVKFIKFLQYNDNTSCEIAVSLRSSQ